MCINYTDWYQINVYLSSLFSPKLYYWRLREPNGMRKIVEGNSVFKIHSFPEHENSKSRRESSGLHLSLLKAETHPGSGFSSPSRQPAKSQAVKKSLFRCQNTTARLLHYCTHADMLNNDSVLRRIIMEKNKRRDDLYRRSRLQHSARLLFSSALFLVDSASAGFLHSVTLNPLFKEKL